MKRMAYQAASQVVSHVRRATHLIAGRSNSSYNFDPMEARPPIASHGVVHHVSFARSHVFPVKPEQTFTHNKQSGAYKKDHAARARTQYSMLPYLDESKHPEALVEIKNDCEKGGRGIEGLEPGQSELEIRRTIFWHTGVRWNEIPAENSQTFVKKCARREHLSGKKESWQEKRLQEYRNQETIYLQ